MELSNEQKSLIWETIVKPKNGTPEEARVFVLNAEQLGLNPLMKEIVFNRYESKQGPVVNYMITRDGLLRVAQEHPNYKRLMSAVVKEGDHFQLDPANGLVEHKFGSKRGNILGAWAVAEHTERGPLAVFAEFDEYFRANAKSQNGRNSVWDDMPSAMITKVAESVALKRQFPLGAANVYTEEEMTVDINNHQNEAPASPKKQQEENKNINKDSQNNKKEKEKTQSEQTKQQSSQSSSQKEEEQPNEVKTEEPKETSQEQATNEETSNPSPSSNKEDENTSNSETEEQKEDTPNEEQESESVGENETLDTYTLLRSQERTSPKGAKILQIEVEGPEGKLIGLVKDEDSIAILDELADGDQFNCTIEEFNGFKFVRNVAV